MNKIKVAGAIASQTGVTLYLANGKEVNLPNDSWRTKAILDEVLPPLARNKTVTIDLDAYSLEKRIEQKTNGVIRFLRQSVSAVGRLFGASQKHDEIKPVTPPAEELVAVVDGVTIRGVEALEKQMERAVFDDGIKGFEAFMKRIAKVAKEREHTVQELLNFMKRGDLPIAEDGSIVAYKVLSSKDDYFVDCHTKKVPQKLGSHVSMAEVLVDPSRRNECSNGLHIARRGYLSNFGGDIITIVKINPEDVIAVPHGEPNKMRVAAYHIVAVLPSRVHSILRSNKPMTGDIEAGQILADVIKGNHVGILERVRIGAAMGGNVTVTSADGRRVINPFTSGVAKALDDENKIGVKDVKKAIAVAEAEKREKKAEKVSRDKQGHNEKSKVASRPASPAPMKNSEAKTAAPAKPVSAKSGTPVWETDKAKELLTDKQREALRIMSEEGLSLRQTSKKLGMSHHTINRAQEKLGLRH